ncbi:MAG: hypothetical protein LAO07_15215, partial [Acidobacteriia bacterium]|nr:hypothetical protein [Terriglobia bacterium]
MKKQKKRRPARPSGPELTAGNVMNRSVIAVRDNLTVQEVAVLLTENEITGAPVTDIAQGAAEGADFSSSGVRSQFRRRDLEGRASRSELDDLHVENAGLPVREIMTPTVY